MRIVFLGCTNFSKKLLEHLINIQANIVGIFSIPESFSISYSETPIKNFNFADLRAYAEKLKVPFYEVNSSKGKKLSDYANEVIELKPDVILVLGWYFIIPAKIRELAKFGAWGIHASLLPDYAGNAPLVWAIINGEKKTGVTLFRLDKGIDDGDIIAQKDFKIAETDTIKEVYEKAIEQSKIILTEIITDPLKITFTPQDKSKIKVYPPRKPDDGQIDLSWPARKIYNFIRAQSPPYPGAFIKLPNGEKLIIEKARIG